jgi:oligopeptidase A
MNPLLTPQFGIPFDQIRAEHVEPAVKEAIAIAERRIEEMAAPQARTYANTLGALDALSDELDYALGVTRHLESVATTPELRAAFNAAEPLAMAFYTRVPLHAGVWQALKEFAATDEARALTGVRKRFLDKTLRSFRKHGADLPAEKKAELEALDVELAQVTTKFSENVLDSTNAWEWRTEDAKQLAGLPPSAMDQAKASAESKQQTGWRFTLQQPSYIAVMTYLDDGGIREMFYRAYQARASSGVHDNSANILKILELRKKKAVMLGYADFSDFALDERMAKTGATAWEFVQGLRKRTEGFFEVENDALEAYRRELEGPGAPALQPWDVAYYAEKLRKARYDFDEEQLRPYFPLEKVVEGMFALVERLYGIRVEVQPGVAAWDAAVKFYRILDSDGAGQREAMLAGFYTDWYPRENKRGGAWMDAFLTGRLKAEGWEPHLGLVCGNLTPPSAGKPALLTHRDVETIFHEFGHLLHHALTRVEVHSLAGTNVAWDFVELPSQIMENWCWEREALDLFARHWETGEAIPPELFEKLRAARTFRAANMQMRQLSFGAVDLLLHREYDPARDGDVILFSKRILQEFSAAPLPEGHAMINSFTHLFASPTGYAAGYYSYKWAEVLDADAFSLFRERGIFSREAGMAFRSQILARGDSDEPATLYRGLMGRDPDPSALFERAGLVGEPAAA